MAEGDKLDEEPVRADMVPDAGVDHAAGDEPALAWRELDRGQHPGYAEQVAHERSRTSRRDQWLALGAASLVAGPFAILGALMDGMAWEGLTGSGALAIIVFGPVLEEMMKIATALWLVERRPWLLSGASSILLLCLCSALAFAAIENLMYLYVYLPDHEPALAQWRWTICLPMHVACTLIAGCGVVRVWSRSRRLQQPARIASAMPFLVAAMVGHGLYNLSAVILEYTGGGTG